MFHDLMLWLAGFYGGIDPDGGSTVDPIGVGR